MQTKLIYIVVAVSFVIGLVAVNLSRPAPPTGDMATIATLENKFAGFMTYSANKSGRVTSLTIGYGAQPKDLNYIVGFIVEIKKMFDWKPVVTSQDLERIGNLTALQNLYLGSSEITKIEGLDKLTGLKMLGLSGNEINDIPDMSKTHKDLKIEF